MNIKLWKTCPALKSAFIKGPGDDVHRSQNSSSRKGASSLAPFFNKEIFLIGLDVSISIKILIKKLHYIGLIHHIQIQIK